MGWKNNGLALQILQVISAQDMKKNTTGEMGSGEMGRIGFRSQCCSLKLVRRELVEG